MIEQETQLANVAYNAGFRAFGDKSIESDSAVFKATHVLAKSFQNGWNDAKQQAELVNRVHAGKGR